MSDWLTLGKVVNSSPCWADPLELWLSNSIADTCINRDSYFGIDNCQ